nr:nuclear protein UL3 [Human alphaherpesvirus 1]
MVKPLVS